MSEGKKRGPKPRAPEEVKRKSLTFRLRDDLRRQIANAAALSGRSLSEEIEARVIASFDYPALVDALAERFTQRVVGLVREDLMGVGNEEPA